MTDQGKQLCLTQESSLCLVQGGVQGLLFGTKNGCESDHCHFDLDAMNQACVMPGLIDVRRRVVVAEAYFYNTEQFLCFSLLQTLLLLKQINV